MDKEDILLKKACFRCGYVDIEEEHTEYDLIEICPSCNENALLSFSTSLDMLNDFFVRNRELNLKEQLDKEYD